MGTPPAGAPGGQWEEEEVPRLGLSHPIGDHVEVLSQQLLAEEEPCCGHCSSHCLGTQLFQGHWCPGDTGSITDLLAHPTPLVA